jgi:hypothetical protein
MALKARNILLRAGYELKRISRRPFARRLSPFAQGREPEVIIHCCYHKVGTVWFGRVLREVAAHFGLSYGSGSTYREIREFETLRNRKIFLDLGSHVQLDCLGNYVGSHMIRDPRDLIVSGYFYHRWTNEPWANLPMAELRGRTYKEYLNEIAKDEGLAAEIRRVAFWVSHMAAWNYQNDRVFEIRYEDIIVDEDSVFEQLFRHYGFNENAVGKSMDIARKYSVRKLKKAPKREDDQKSHIRSGRVGDWRDHFNPEQKALFKELYPGVLIKLGYEGSDEW